MWDVDRRSKNPTASMMRSSDRTWRGAVPSRYRKKGRNECAVVGIVARPVPVPEDEGAGQERVRPRGVDTNASRYSPRENPTEWIERNCRSRSAAAGEEEVTRKFVVADRRDLSELPSAGRTLEQQQRRHPASAGRSERVQNHILKSSSSCASRHETRHATGRLEETRWKTAPDGQTVGPPSRRVWIVGRLQSRLNAYKVLHGQTSRRPAGAERLSEFIRPDIEPTRVGRFRWLISGSFGFEFELKASIGSVGRAVGLCGPVRRPQLGRSPGQSVDRSTGIWDCDGHFY